MHQWRHGQADSPYHHKMLLHRAGRFILASYEDADPFNRLDRVCRVARQKTDPPTISSRWTKPNHLLRAQKCPSTHDSPIRITQTFGSIRSIEFTRADHLTMTYSTGRQHHILESSIQVSDDSRWNRRCRFYQAIHSCETRGLTDQLNFRDRASVYKEDAAEPDWATSRTNQPMRAPKALPHTQQTMRWWESPSGTWIYVLIEACLASTATGTSIAKSTRPIYSDRLLGCPSTYDETYRGPLAMGRCWVDYSKGCEIHEDRARPAGRATAWCALSSLSINDR